MIYLDYSANTPVDPRVLEVYCRTEQNFIGNPNSTHCAGQAARQEMNRVTGLIAAQLGVLPEEIIYTSGATEANNLALKGTARAARHVGRHIISTPLEHSSVGATLTALQQQGYEIDLLNIGRDGRIDLEQLEELLRKDTVLVSICGVDSELGTVQPVREIAALVHRCPNCRLHVDATQAVGKTALWLDCVDTMSFTAHKFYGPNGIGVLYKRKGLVIEPQMNGGASTTITAAAPPPWALPRLCRRRWPLRWMNSPSAAPMCRRCMILCAQSCKAPRRAHQQPGGCGAAHCKRERGGYQGRSVPAGVERAGGMCVRQIGLLHRRHTVQGGVCRQPGPQKCAQLMAHQPEPPDHRRGTERIFGSI